MIIIGDVHGCFDTLMALLDTIPQDEKDKGVVFTGDLIDRGPKSKQVVDFVKNNGHICVMGNHERMMIDEAKRVTDFIVRTGLTPRGNVGSLWTVNGGYETLNSYRFYDQNNLDDRGVPFYEFDYGLFEEHLDWMRTLPLYEAFANVKYENGRYLLVTHSNVGNVWKYKHQYLNSSGSRFESEVLWGRPSKIKDVPEIYNVIGHTPQEHNIRIRSNYAIVDTGCYYTNGGFGKLSALQFPEMIVYEQENIDDKIGSTNKKRNYTVEDIKKEEKSRRYRK